jgi:hypothetical protein
MLRSQFLFRSPRFSRNSAAAVLPWSGFCHSSGTSPVVQSSSSFISFPPLKFSFVGVSNIFEAKRHFFPTLRLHNNKSDKPPMEKVFEEEVANEDAAAYELLIACCKKIIESDKTDVMNAKLAKEVFLSSVSATEPFPLGVALREWYRENGAEKEQVAKNSLLQFFVGLSDEEVKRPKSLTEALLPKLRKIGEDYVPAKTIGELASTLSLVFGLSNVIRSPGSSLTQRHIESPYEMSVSSTVQNRVSATSYVPSQVFAIGGSSGCGKTVLALHVAKMKALTSDYSPSQDNVVIYLVGPDLTDKKTNKNRWDENENAKSTTEKTIRNANAERALLFAIESAIESAIGHGFPLGAVLCPDAAHTTYRVTIVIDEAGHIPVFVRALCASVKALGAQLHEKFFKSTVNKADVDFDEICRVRFVVAGAGLPVADSGQAVKIGTANETYTGVFLDRLSVKFSQVMECFFRDSAELSRYGCPEMWQRLLRLDADSPLDVIPALSPAELLARSLVKNARCAALLLFHLRYYWCRMPKTVKPGDASKSNDESKESDEYEAALDSGREIFGRQDRICRFDDFDGIYDRVLSGLLPLVVREYINKNGLADFEQPERVLLSALAASVFRLRELPEDWSVIGRLVSDKQRFDTLHDALARRAGILVDTAVLETSVEKPEDNLQHYFKTVDGRFVPNSGRFLFSEAHIAMLHVLFNTPRRCETTDGFELAVADFCTLVAACGPFYLQMKQQLKNELGSSCAIEPKFNKKLFPNDEGAIHALAENLCFPSKSDNDCKINVLYLKNNEFMAQLERFVTTDVHLQEALKTLEHENYLGAVKHGQTVVVMVSAPKESFADVIVAGPNRLILIQCKTKKRAKSISYVQELAKMALLHDAEAPISSDEAKKNRIPRFGFGNSESWFSKLDAVVEECGCSCKEKLEKCVRDEKNDANHKFYPNEHQQDYLFKLIQLCKSGENPKVDIQAYIVVEAGSEEARQTLQNQPFPSSADDALFHKDGSVAKSKNNNNNNNNTVVVEVETDSSVDRNPAADTKRKNVFKKRTDLNNEHVSSISWKRICFATPLAPESSIDSSNGNNNKATDGKDVKNDSQTKKAHEDARRYPLFPVTPTVTTARTVQRPERSCAIKATKKIGVVQQNTMVKKGENSAASAKSEPNDDENPQQPNTQNQGSE